MRPRITIEILIFICLAGSACSAFAQPVVVKASSPEQAADEKAAAGEYAGAISLYKTQWISCAAGMNEGNADTQATRERLAEKMGKTLTKYQKSPVIGDETELHALKGAAFVKNAKSPADFEKAVKEFQDAVNGAPWMFDFQFNLAVSLKSAGQFKTALGYARVAKLLAQTDKDRHDALGLRAEIEAGGEMAASAVEAAKKAEQDRQSNEVAKINGKWKSIAILVELATDGSSCTVLNSRTAVDWQPLQVDWCKIVNKKPQLHFSDARHNYWIECEFTPAPDGSMDGQRINGGWSDVNQKVITWGCNPLVRPS